MNVHHALTFGVLPMVGFESLDVVAEICMDPLLVVFVPGIDKGSSLGVYEFVALGRANASCLGEDIEQGGFRFGSVLFPSLEEVSLDASEGDFGPPPSFR